MNAKTNKILKKLSKTQIKEFNFKIINLKYFLDKHKFKVLKDIKELLQKKDIKEFLKKLYLTFLRVK